MGKPIVRTSVGRFAIVPLWLIMNSSVGALAIRLFALLAAKYADRDDATCWPSRRALAIDLEIAALSTIDLALGQLKQAGALVVKQQHDAVGDLTSSLYTLIFDDPTAGSNGQTSSTERRTGGENRRAH